jgi:RNA-binding protein YlmH
MHKTVEGMRVMVMVMVMLRVRVRVRGAVRSKSVHLNWGLVSMVSDKLQP